MIILILSLIFLLGVVKSYEFEINLDYCTSYGSGVVLEYPRLGKRAKYFECTGCVSDPFRT